MRKSFLAALVCLSLSTPAWADKVILTNGDILTGKVENFDGKTLTIATEKAGEVKIDMHNVRTFSTDTPVDFRLTDGTEFHLRAVATTEPSTQPSIAVGPSVIGAQTFTLNQIKAINPPPVAWHGDVTVGGDFLRGNTFSDAYHLGYDLNRRSDQDRFTSQGSYQYGKQKDPGTGVKSVSVDNWTVGAKFDHFFDGTKWYDYVGVLAQKDLIQDLNLRFIPSAGIGYQWFESPQLNFDTEAGVSWIYEDYSTQTTSEEIALRFAEHFDKQLTDHTKIINDIEYLPSLQHGEKFLVNADIGLHIDITKALFAEGKIIQQYNSQPAPGKHKNDEQYLVSIGWKF